MPVGCGENGRHHQLSVRAAGGMAHSLFPAGLAQAFEHVNVVFGPVPGHACADISVECRRRDRDCLLQSLLRLIDTPDLA